MFIMKTIFFCCSIIFTQIAFAQVYQKYQAKEFAGSEGTLLYRILEPPELESKSSYPLVIFLHGSGERGNDNRKQLTHVAHNFLAPNIRYQYPAFVVFPQCPQDERWANGERRDDRNLILKDEASKNGQLVMELIGELENKLPIDPKRIYIAGLSMGGFGTWDLISRFPEKFAAAIPVCGGGDPDKIEKAANLPIWAAHGADDSVVPVTTTRAMVKALKKVNAPIIYSEFRGVNHNSWVTLFDQNPLIFDWLFAQFSDTN